MKRTRLGAIACLLLTVGMTAKASETVLVKSAGRDDVKIALAERPTVTMSGAELKVSTAELTVTYPLTEQVTFTLVDESSVEELSSSVLAIRQVGDMITLSGLKAGEAVSLYTLDGRLAAKTEADAQGAASLSLPAKGAFILSTPSKSLKLIK